jgi:hypothetical protein
MEIYDNQRSQISYLIQHKFRKTLQRNITIQIPERFTLETLEHLVTLGYKVVAQQIHEIDNKKTNVYYRLIVELFAKPAYNDDQDVIISIDNRHGGLWDADDDW